MSASNRRQQSSIPGVLFEQHYRKLMKCTPLTTAFVGVGEESEAPTDSYRWIFPLTVVSSELLVIHIAPLFRLTK